MVAVFKKMEDKDSSSEEEDPQSDSESNSVDNVQLTHNMGGLARTPCVVHTLQLVIMIQKDTSVRCLLDKV